MADHHHSDRAFSSSLPPGYGYGSGGMRPTFCSLNKAIRLAEKIRIDMALSSSSSSALSSPDQAPHLQLVTHTSKCDAG
jgi:pantoate kinase